MSLDPSIALQVQPVQIQNPLTQYAQVAAIQDAQQRNKLLDLSIADKQREVGQNAALNDAYARNLNADGTVNQQGLLGAVVQSGYGSAIPGIQKSLMEADTAKLTQQKTRLEAAGAQLQTVGQVLGSVTDQASWDAARQWAHTNLGPSSLDNAPAVYDPTVIANARKQALTVLQQLDEQHKTLADQLAQSQFTETQRHNQATEGNAAGQLAVSQANSATEAASALTRGLEYDAKNGVVINKRTGQSVPVRDAQGNPIATTAANLTGEQSNAVAFGARALDAQNTLRQLEASGITNGGRIKQGVEGIPVVGNALGNAVNSLPTWAGAPNDQQQSYEQAQRNFVSAVLRKESGAAISNEEYANEAKKYFPQPGDSAATIEQKARARDLAIEGLKAQAGPGASMIGGIISNANQDYGNQPRPAAQQPAAQKQPAAQIAPDAARAELLRRAANNPALAAKLQAMGH
ncbi:hypothetical protein IAG25_35615 [Caballeronia sp. EK]|uniref:hypothetical protein n=1 Tax=Caballeronia sp. EK TaxID=2767469 RepID=UPI0016553736|nr:hypothetical protein [Caballeronia sp. EK]MBC8642136.1 hypothetical protein [Caballeronia sp. EK]